jgi:peptidyl-prolyl cis-trans isomerase C
MSVFLSAPAVGFLVAAGLAVAANAAEPSNAAVGSLPPGNPVVARVDGVELHLSDVQAAQQSLPPQAQKAPLEQIYPMLLNRLVDGALITEAGRKEHLDQDPCADPAQTL